MAEVGAYAAAAIAPATRQAYSAGEKRFINFCRTCRWEPFPATDLRLSAFAAFLARSLKPGTIRAYICAVRNAHDEMGFEDPTADAPLLKRVLKGIDRTKTAAATRPRLPVTMPVLRRLIEALFRRHMNALDRLMLNAALLTAFHGFLRCGEFTSRNRTAPFDPRKQLTRGDVVVQARSAKIRLKVSKTDPRGQGVTIHIGAASQPYCAVTALRLYLTLTTGDKDSPLFTYQSGERLTREKFVDETRSLLVAAGIPNIDHYSGHSFRIGAATTSAVAGAPEWLIRTMGRWRSDAVLRYIRTDVASMHGMAATLVAVDN